MTQQIQRVTSAPVVQSKLAINKPGDVYEQEADRVADQVMRMSSPSRSAAALVLTGAGSSAQRKCAECEEEEKQKLQKKDSPGASPAADQASVAPPLVHEALRSGGQPLNASTREFMESRFNHDFSQVRVHADGRAAESARTINALAYTLGEHIVFGGGRYAPATLAGQKLLAHELAHVVQQRRLGTRRLVQRAAVQYVEQVADTDPTAGQILGQFDRSVAAIEQNLKSQTGPQITDLTAAAARLKALRSGGKVAVWRMITTPPVYATFDNGSGQMRLNYSYPDISVSESTLVHEAIHAVHAAANPEISAAYAKGLKSGVPAADTAALAVVHKWKAWTEYWAYRRAAEYSAGARLASDPDMGHRIAMENSDVRFSVMTAKGDDPNFDPKTWQPTAADRATALRFTGKSGATAKP